MIPCAVSSVTATDCASATGASFTPVTVIETAAKLESTVPSLALKIKLSLPLKFALGV